MDAYFAISAHDHRAFSEAISLSPAFDDTGTINRFLSSNPSAASRMRATGRESEEKGSAESGAFKSFQQDKIRGHNRGGILGETFQVAILASEFAN